jgi:hypothetical protein
MFPSWDKLGEILSVPNIWHSEAKQTEVLRIPQRKQHCYSLTFVSPCIFRYIPYIQPRRCHFSQLIYFNNALHISGGTSTHHQELRLYIQLLVFVKPCCYRLRSWSQQAAARFDKYQKLYVQSELLVTGGGSTQNVQRYWNK